jgi:hypothetical protein
LLWYSWKLVEVILKSDTPLMVEEDTWTVRLMASALTTTAMAASACMATTVS